MKWRKNDKLTAGSVMHDVAQLSDGNLIEVYHRCRALISQRSGEREAELAKLKDAHDVAADSKLAIIEALHHAIGFTGTARTQGSGT